MAGPAPAITPPGVIDRIDLRELRRLRVEVIPTRRRDFEEDRDTPGELAEAVAREGRLVHGH